MSDIPFPPPPAPPAPVRAAPVVSPGVANAVPPASNPDDDFNRRLMSFGAAMAQSTSPSFFAQLGAGFGAVQSADQQDRRNALQAREIDVMERYRMAQVAVEEAKLAAEQDPDSPRNQLLLAQTRAAEVQARAALANAGAGNRPNFVAGEDDQGMVFFDPRTGQQVRPPAGMRAPGQMGRTEAAELRAQQAAEQRALELTRVQFANNPMANQADVMRAYRDNLAAILGERRPPAERPAAADPAGRVRIGIDGRPITAP